jgi:hypothetical protein
VNWEGHPASGWKSSVNLTSIVDEKIQFRRIEQSRARRVWLDIDAPL